MKKIFTNLFLLATLFLASTNLTAQTYDNGTWYSLYDANGFNLETKITSINGVQAYRDVFAPVGGNLTFNWQYSGSILKSHDTYIYESSDGGSNYSGEKGHISGTGSGTGSVSLSTNINKIKFDRPRGNTNTVKYTNIKLPLKKHILLASGDYGTTSVEKKFANSVTINETSSEIVTVKLRSFLTAGNISISSDNPAFYVATSTYAVGANACASANGAASSMAGGSTLGNIKNYDVLIYFHPTSAGTHNGTITLTDGTSTATIKVSGTCNKKAPEVTSWPKVTPITYGTPLTLDMLVGGNANVPGNFECAELPTTLNAGTHKISVRFVPENQNIYTIVEEKIDIIVKKADATITTIPNAINDLAYSGEEQTLITEGSAEGGKIVYSLDGNTFTENVPTATNAGEYTVYYKVVGDENHNDVAGTNTIVVTIKKATLTITAEDKSVTYGEEAPTYSATYSGWKAQDNEEVLVGEMTFECEYNTNSNVGTYDINISGVEAQNYEITFVSGVLTVNKADATITNTPNAINDLVYSGEEQTLITEGKAEGGKIVYSLEGNTFTEDVPTATNAGEYTVYYKVVGDENHNDVEGTNSIVVTIKKATLTITAEDKSVTYGEEAPTYSATYSGWKAQDNEDVLVGEMTFECEYNTNSNVGTYAINISGVEAQNYEITFVSGVLTVNKADATITNTPNAINDLVYSGEEQTLITEGKAEGGKIVYSLDGNTFTEDVPTATNAGEYTVYYKVVGDENHNDVEGTNSIVVTIKKATLTITAEDKSVTYGEEAPTYSATYSGWKAQDNEEVLVGEMTFECEYNTNSNVGTYAINISGVEAQNYEITFVSGVLTVNKADATITNTPNAINDLVYSGEEQTLITEGSAEGGKIVYSLDGNTFTENVPTATNAGEYTVCYKVVGDENHNGIEDTNAIVVTIKKATLTITAEDKSVTYGEEAPTYSATYSGWKAQDNEDVLVGEITFECEYNTNSNVGTYDINISGVEAQNYEITFVSGVLIVNKADATITNTPNAINDLVYSGEEQTLITGGSAEGGKIVYSLDGNRFTENVPTATNAGEYTVYYKVVGDENHNDVEETNSIVVIIKKATQSITWNDNIENIQTIDNITLNAIANTDIHYTSSDSTIAYVENKTLIINKYGVVTITAITKESNNYTQAIESKDITISRATPSITWNISDTLTVGNSIHLDAVASNNAEVLYEIIGEEGILKYDNQAKTLTAMAAGTTTILAYTEENDIYNAAEYQYTITVVLDSNPSTNITNTTINDEKAQKIFVNGKLYIIRNNQWYDTTGKLVK